MRGHFTLNPIYLIESTLHFAEYNDGERVAHKAREPQTGGHETGEPPFPDIQELHKRESLSIPDVHCGEEAD
jgi:hypothetical protein